MNYSIQHIHVADRKRSADPDKVRQLAASIAEIGLINPITIAPSGRLIAGLHRLEACKSLGLAEVEVTILDADPLDEELAEIDENLLRNDLTVLQQGEHLLRRNQILEEKGLRAQRGDNRFTIDRGEIVSPLKTTAEIATDIGLNERSAQQRTQIARNLLPEVKEAIRDLPIADSTTQLLALARLDPSQQMQAANKIASGAAENVGKALTTLRNERKAQTASSLPTGVYNVLYADPPWEYDNTGVHGAADHHYPTMPLDDICSLLDDRHIQVADNAVLFLWVTNPFLQDAFFVVNSWGFAYKTNVVWVKTDLVKPGSGFYVRGRHELLLICTRGSFTPLNPNISPPIGSVITAPVQEHSRKPDEVYDIIERLYPGCSYLELFARRSREGWEVWGNDIAGE